MMNYSESIGELTAGKIRSVYLLHGEESYLTAQLEAKIIGEVLAPADRDMNLVVFDGDPTIDELITTVETVPFLGSKQMIVVKGTKCFSPARGPGGSEGAEKTDKADERLLKMLQDIPEYSYVLFVAREKADKRRKTYKLIDKVGACIEMSPLKGKDVIAWIQMRLKEMNKSFDEEAMATVITVVGTMQEISLGFLDQELEKLALYSEGRSKISHEDVTILLSSIPEISAFAMTDCLSRKEIGKALSLLEQQLANGVYPLRILGMLAFEVRRLWQIRVRIDAGEGVREIADFLRLPTFIAEKMIRQSRNFSNASLKKALLALADADYQFKSSRADPGIFGKIMIELCQ